MGGLAIASYVSGISGVEYEKDINKFIALGSPFKGSSWANLTPEMLQRLGPAYNNLKPGSEAINELQSAWSQNYKSLGVDFYSLQSKPWDGVVSWSSSTSLKGSKNIQINDYDGVPIFHTAQTKDIWYKMKVYELLTGK